MAGVVAFTGTVMLEDPFFLSNSTQNSVGNDGTVGKRSVHENNTKLESEVLPCSYRADQDPRLTPRAPVFQEFRQLAHGTSAVKEENR